MKRFFVLAILFAVATSAALASTPQPYAGQQQRSIKALSDSDIEGYLAGRGMGFAKAAELNHYPGPRHVLDLADQLALTAAQRTQTQAVFDAMQGDAVRLGRELVEKERALDTYFASGRIDDTTLGNMLHEIGRIQAELRRVHLAAHLKQKAILTPHQVVMYDELRGYGSDGAHNGEMHHHHH